MKRKLFYVLLVCLSVLLICMLGVGCSNNNSNDDESTKTVGSIQLNVAGQYPLDHQNTKSLMAAAEEIKTQTDNRVVLNVYPAGQLGDYTVIYEELMNGTIDMALISLPSDYEPKFELLYLNYLASTYKEAKDIYSPGSTLYDTIDQLNQVQGVKLLGFHAEGFTGVITTKEIVDPLKFDVDHKVMLRIPTMKIFKVSADSLNFRTVSIPYEEVYVGMQTGVVDGSMNIPANLAYSSFKDVGKYFYGYNNFFEVTSFLISKNKWEEIDPTDQAIIENVISEVATASFDLIEKDDIASRKSLKEAGINVIEFSDEELAALAERNRTQVWPLLKDQFGSDFIDNLMKQY